MYKNNKIIALVVFFGFFISVLLSLSNLSKYDKNIQKVNGDFYHQMIKADAYNYIRHGNEIKNQIKDGSNFFETGREHYTKYLPPRIYAAYYHFFDYELYNNIDEKKINIGIHLPYLVLQSLLYYFTIILLYLSITKILSQKVSFFIVCFLCFEPTILQYHSSFWSESVFFSLQILLISLILNKNKSNFRFFIIGIFLTILSFQKEYSIFYIIPLIIYFYTTNIDFFYKKLLFLIFGFFLSQSFLGYNNYQRSGHFYIMTSDSKINLHIDLVAKVMQSKFDINGKNFDVIEGEASLDWIQKNSIKINKKELSDKEDLGFMDYRKAILEKDKVKFDEFIRTRTIDYLYKYPIDFIKFAIKSSFHSILLNPFHIYSDNNYISGEFYYTTDVHDKLIPYRIIYSLLIYIVCFYGLYFMIREKKYNILIYLIFSIIYFYGLVSWHGNTRYFMPVAIYLSFFFGYGLNKIVTDPKKT